MRSARECTQPREKVKNCLQSERQSPRVSLLASRQHRPRSPLSSPHATLTMFDPLSTTFGEEPTPPWPTTPRTPHTPIPNMPRPSTPRHPSSRPQTPDRSGSDGLYGKQPQIYGQPESGLISPAVTTGSNGVKYEKNEPYLRVRITGMDRNRKDILIKFDAQVYYFPPVMLVFKQY